MSYIYSDASLSIQFLRTKAASLLLYQGVFAGAVGQAFLSLLESLSQTREDELGYLLAYGNWFKTLAASGESWQDYLIWQILCDDNPFSRAAQQVPVSDLPYSLVAAVKQDLQTLQLLYEQSNQQLSLSIRKASKSGMKPIVWDMEPQAPSFLPQQSDWANAWVDLANHYRDNGAGLFAQYRALRWQSGELVGIRHPDPVELGELVGYESQQEALVKNTEFLLAGYSALHVLLYGSRGSGKSSLVKALLQKYSDRGLRLIEVAKSDLRDLSAIVERLREVPQKFIIFVDDLSFEEDDEAFKALKVVLEGSVTARSQNIVVYATSNRRHLIREYFSDRPRPSDNDEVHAWDTVQEKLSFSDRFGLTLTFEPANQDTYLKIVRHLADLVKIDLPQEELDYRALQWATRHNGRCGRSARQFIDFLTAEISAEYF